MLKWKNTSRRDFTTCWNDTRNIGGIKMTIDEYIKNTKEQFESILPTLNLEDIKRIQYMGSWLNEVLEDRWVELVMENNDE